jgi:hypothetical protein
VLKIKSAKARHAHARSECCDHEDMSRLPKMNPRNDKVRGETEKPAHMPKAAM